MAAAQFPYLGTESRLYSQYLDVTDDGQKPLEAEPGNSYAILAGPGYDVKDKAGNVTSTLPMPPGDGLWGDQENTKETVARKDDAPADSKSTRKGASA